MFRKALFWTHLCAGVAAGLVIAMMSVTGVILTYERQLGEWADLRAAGPIDVVGEPLTLEALLASAAASDPDFETQSLTVHNDPQKPVELGGGRGAGTRYVNPYTGELLGSGATGVHAFLSSVRSWHRWFNASGDNRDTWRSVTGAANLLFLFLLVSGAYLWLPPIWRRAAFRMRLKFQKRPVNGRARDFNWHHVLGVWSVLPLIVIVASAAVISYPWAGDLVYRTFGEEPPARGAREQVEAPMLAAGDEARPLAELFAVAAAARADDWERISISLPDPDAGDVTFGIDRGTGGQPQLRDTLTVDRVTGKVVAFEPFASRTAGAKARSWLRFLHTGEALGILGQTVAGIVSAASVVMVWTGLALAWRRLVSPILKRRRKRRELALEGVSG